MQMVHQHVKKLSFNDAVLTPSPGVTSALTAACHTGTRNSSRPRPTNASGCEPQQQVNFSHVAIQYQVAFAERLLLNVALAQWSACLPHAIRTSVGMCHCGSVRLPSALSSNSQLPWFVNLRCLVHLPDGGKASEPIKDLAVNPGCGPYIWECLTPSNQDCCQQHYLSPQPGQLGDLCLPVKLRLGCWQHSQTCKMSCWFGCSPLTPLACCGVFAAGLASTSSCRRNAAQQAVRKRRSVRRCGRGACMLRRLCCEAVLDIVLWMHRLRALLCRTTLRRNKEHSQYTLVTHPENDDGC